VVQCLNPPHTRLVLNEFQASCYSHNKSQSALSETNWLLRVSECNLSLNPYQIISMGHHHELPLTRVMELRPDHWSTTMRSHLEAHGITHWHKPIILNQSSIIYHAHNSHANLYNQIHIHIPCWIHSNSSFPIHEYRIYFIPIPCHFDTNLSQPRSRRDDKNNLKKYKGVATIVYYGKL